MREIAEQMNKLVRAGDLTPPRELIKYSRFLGEFEAAEYQDRELEIPGLWYGVQKKAHQEKCQPGKFPIKYMERSLY